jgi:probable rRNA maturation factor
MVPGAAALTDAEAWRTLGLSRGGLVRFLRTAQAAVGLRGEVSVLLADDRTLRRLNRDWRGKDKATDVLSFPSPEEMSAVFAGDLAVSLETAQRQGAAYGNELRDEVRVLLLHGLLHLAGMDHETDGGEMAAREAELRKRLRLRSGLIARASGKQTSGAKAPFSSKAMKPEAKASGYPSVPGAGKRRFPSGMTKKMVAA